MEIPLNVDVLCSNRLLGRSTCIILNPVTEEVTHFVVKMGGLLGEEYLIPLEAIFECTSEGIKLRWSQDDVAKAEPFIKSVFIGKDEESFLAESMSASTFMWPYAVSGGVYPDQVSVLATFYEQVKQIPPEELAVNRGTEVEAIDGRVGKVDEFLIDPVTNHITHLVLRKGHIWGERDITIPVSQIDRVESGAVYLKLDKEAVNGLPSIVVHRK